MNGVASVAKDATAWVGIVGFGLMWSWLYVCTLEVNASAGGYAYMLISSTVEFLAFSSLLLLPRRILDLLFTRSRLVMTVAMLCTAAVTMMFFAPGLPDSGLVRVGHAVTLGLGFSAFAMAWGLAFARVFTQEEMLRAVLLSALVMVLVRAPFALAFTQAGMMIVSAALPLVSCVLYTVFTSKGAAVGNSDAALPGVGVSSVKPGHLLELFSIAMPMTLLLGMLPVGREPMSTATLFALLAFAVLAVACMAAESGGRRMVRAPLMSSTALLVAAYLAFALGEIGYGASAVCISLSAFIYDAGIWAFGMRFAAAGGARGFRNLCKIKGVFSFSHVFAFAFVVAAIEFNLDASQHGAILLAVLAICLAVNRLCIPEPIEADLWERKGDASSSADEASGNRLADAPNGLVLSADASLPESPVERPSFDGEIAEGDGPRTFEGKCAALSVEGGLTKREAEIMVLLARGHNRAHIKETLFLAEGTLNTHTMNIYRKVGVHSQQELINLVDKGHPLD